MKKRVGDPLYRRKIAIIDKLIDKGYNKSLELKMLKKLLETYDLEFLETLRLDFRPLSLIWCIGKMGKKEIERSYKVYLLRKERQVIELIHLSEEKIGEDRKIEKKETLIKFLNEKKE